MTRPFANRLPELLCGFGLAVCHGSSFANFSASIGATATTGSPPPRLSEEQSRWAAGRTLRVASDPDFGPFSVLGPDNRITGVDHDMLDTIAALTGLTFETVIYRSWTEVWEALLGDEVDLVTGCAFTEERQSQVLFTEPYAQPRLAIVARQDAHHGWTVDDLHGLTLAIPRGHVVLQDVHARIPSARVATCLHLAESLQLVASRQADVSIVNLASAVTLLPDADYAGLKVIGFYDKHFPLRLAVRPGLPELVPILDIGIAATRRQYDGSAYVEWVDARLDEWADQGRRLRRDRAEHAALVALAAAFAALAAFAWWWTRRRRAGACAPASGDTATDVLGGAFEMTSLPLFVVQLPDLILVRNTSARRLVNDTMVLPAELAELAARLATLPPETPEAFEWAPPGRQATHWQARLLPMSGGRGVLMLLP